MMLKSRRDFFKMLLGLFGFKFTPILPHGRVYTGKTIPFDPVNIATLRRVMPELLAVDICNVQPMLGPTGMIFSFPNRPIIDRKVRYFESKKVVEQPVTWLEDYQRFSHQIGYNDR